MQSDIQRRTKNGGGTDETQAELCAIISASCHPKEPNIPVTSSVSFVRYVLSADAISCLACGLLQVTLTTVLSERLGLPMTLLAETGIFLLLYGAALVFLATRILVPSTMLWPLIMANMAWAVAGIAVRRPALPQKFQEAAGNLFRSC